MGCEQNTTVSLIQLHALQVLVFALQPGPLLTRSPAKLEKPIAIPVRGFLWRLAQGKAARACINLP